MDSKNQQLWIKNRSRVYFALDLILILLALWLAISVRYSNPFHFSADQMLLNWMGPVALASIPLLLVRRVWAIQPRYVGLHDFVNISLVSVILGGVVRITRPNAVTMPFVEGWTVPFLFAFFSVLFVAGWRIVRRMAIMNTQADHGQPLRKVLIVGAGDEGESAYRGLVRLQETSVQILGFVDDSQELRHTTVHGIPVLGVTSDIPRLAESLGFNEILIAHPDPDPAELRRIFDICANTKARIRILPSFSAIVGGQDNLIPHMRNLDVRDLLRRESMESNKALPLDYIAGERVLITGAGGSIGSELCRQVARLSPASIILLGKGEGSIFEIEQELRRATPVHPISTIADVRDRSSVAEIMRKHVPTVVFHAAAHKHVPFMERVPIEAIRNNVFGTLNMVEGAISAGAKKFILVSTDKAVKPANVMGATKRVSEMIVASKSQTSDTDFAIVRFGNVLGSRGSLVPLINKQIAAGGPVTITHPEMTRFFMTIPEASELILSAGAMGRTGEIFVLDMGEAIKIEELVRKIIRLHGLVPGQDIAITYTGIRPGEKLHEELYFSEELATPSSHQKIRVASQVGSTPWEWLKIELDRLWDICETGDSDEARAALMELAWGKNSPMLKASSPTKVKEEERQSMK
jgi:FlaA1/EpsC-like NDP-sugar epimerase